MLLHVLREISWPKKTTCWRALVEGNCFPYHRFRENPSYLHGAIVAVGSANFKTTVMLCETLIEMYFPVQPFSNLYKYQSFWGLLSVFVSEWEIYKKHMFQTATEYMFRRMWPLNFIKLFNIKLYLVQSFDEHRILLLIMSLFNNNPMLAKGLLVWDGRNKALKHGPIEVPQAICHWLQWNQDFAKNIKCFLKSFH